MLYNSYYEQGLGGLEMARKFSDLVKKIQRDWTPEEWREYEALDKGFQAYVKIEQVARVEIGRAVAQARKAESLSQKDLAERSLIQQSEISRIERGSSNPTALTLVRLANALGQQWSLQPPK